MSTATEAALARLGEVVGAAHLLAEPAQLSEYEVDGLRPAAAAGPGSLDELAELVRFAAREKLAVLPVGARTKLRLGAPPRRYDLAIDLTRLNRVLAYDPADLTLSVEAGMPIAQLQHILAGQRQFLPLDPPFTADATLGGILATNSTGPLRHAYGTARDFVLGMEFVTGHAARTKSGGRVVKNVAGYDLHKLMIGALGTLGIITSVNFKTFPLPRATATFIAFFGHADEALALRRRIAQSPLQPRAVEMIDPRAARILAPERRRLSATGWSVVVAVGGNERVVERHAADLSRIMQEEHATSFVALSGEEEAALWERIREFPRLAMEFSPAATILKMTAPPTQFPSLLDHARRVTEQYDLAWAAVIRAAGVVYLALVPPARDDSTLRRLAQASTELIHAGTTPTGRVIIEWCPLELKRDVNVWGPARDDLVLMQKLKRAFDPECIFSPGRFWGGI